MVSNAVEGKGIYFNPTSLDFIKVVGVVSLAVQERIAKGCALLETAFLNEPNIVIEQILKENGINVPDDFNEQTVMEKVLIDLVALPTMLKVSEIDDVVLLHMHGKVVGAGNKNYVEANIMGNREYKYLDEVEYSLYVDKVADLGKRELLKVLCQMGKLNTYGLFRYYNDNPEIEVPYCGNKVIKFDVRTRQIQIKSEIMLPNYRGRKRTLLNTINTDLQLQSQHLLSLEKYNSGRYKDYIYCTSTFDYCKDGCVTKESIFGMIAEHEEVINKVRDVINEKEEANV